MHPISSLGYVKQCGTPEPLNDIAIAPFLDKQPFPHLSRASGFKHWIHEEILRHIG